jgi:archaellum component FlaC
MLSRIDTLQKKITDNSRSHYNEARVGALVPLVEESYGIYEQELARIQELERQRMEEERLRFLQQQQQQNQAQMFQSQMMEAQNQLEQMRQQSFRDKETIDQYMARMRMLEDQVNLLNARNDHEQVLKLSEEVNVWKQKYEALAKVYAQLRKEHMDLLTKYKQLKDAGSVVSDQAKAEVEKMRGELKVILSVLHRKM